MVAKKNYLKKKLDEKKTEILLQIVEEEVEKAYSQILLKEYGGEFGDGGYDSSDSGSGGSVKNTVMDRSKFVGAFTGPVGDLAAIGTKFATNLGIATAGLVGVTIASSIAALLPFNNPDTVKWIGEKFRAWESKSMNFVEQQFRTETEKLRQGWETFKNDFWGIGFVASPFGAIAAAATAMKGVDVALSISNIVTGGKVGSLLQKINEVEDPGTLEDYLNKSERKKEEEIRKKQKDLEKQMYTDTCLQNLKDPNWISPECLGFANRSMFPAGDEGQRDFIEFVTRNANSLERIRRNRYQIEFGKEPGYNYFTGLDDNNIIRLLKNNGYIKENYIHIPSNKIIQEEKKINIQEQIQILFKELAQGKAKNPASNFESDFSAAMSGPPSGVSVADTIAQIKKKLGEEKTNKLLQQIIEKLVADPTAQAAATQWSEKNLPTAMGAFSDLNKSIVAGEVPQITAPQIRDYMTNGAGTSAVESVKQTAKFPIPPDRLARIAQIVQTNAQKDLAPLQQAIAQQSKPTQP